MVLGEVEGVGDFLLAAHQCGETFFVFERLIGLGGEVGDALAGVGDAFGEIGGGFIEVLDDVLDGAHGAEVVIRGAGTYTAKVTDTALGTMRSIEHVIQNLDETVTDLAKGIVDTRKRIADLAAQTDQPFEYEERLSSLIRRQQEIADALDLTKNQASARLEADSPKDSPIAETEAGSLKEAWDEEWL